MSLLSKMSKSTPTHAGGARKGKTPQWQALESSDEEELTLSQKIALNPLLAALCRGDVSWADDAEGPLGRPSASFIVHAAAMAANHQAAKVADREAAEAVEELQAMEEASIWHQPFSRNLEAHCRDRYDLGDLTEPEYEACMTWLYAGGWHVAGARANLEAYPADLPPRVWVADRFASLMEDAPAPAPASAAPVAAKPKAKKATTVPRFCRASSGGVACADAACRYVHEDTMPRLNEPCAFGAACGGTDPAKRALCIRMHPGETWTALLVVSRPQAPCACTH
jgi:hypothetical protein